MAYYQVQKDYTKAEGAFQVISLMDEDGEEWVAALGIDQGYHYHTDEQLKVDIAQGRKRLDLPEEEIDLEEM